MELKAAKTGQAETGHSKTEAAGAGQNRAYFPRGLYQPPGSFRFSADALLLAAFAGRAARAFSGGPKPLPVLELGCGCGAVALGFLLLYPAARVVALDLQEDLVEAARLNARSLGFEQAFSAVAADLQGLEGPGDLAALLRPAWPEGGPAFKLVLANPPYRLPGRGRQPASLSRRLALFGGAENLRAFVRAAAWALAPEGRFCLVWPPDRLKELEEVLRGCGLEICLDLPVRSRAGAAPGLLLLAARRAGTGETVIAGPAQNAETGGPLPESLVLHAEGGAGKVFSAEALDFCPFLGT